MGDYGSDMGTLKPELDIYVHVELSTGAGEGVPGDVIIMSPLPDLRAEAGRIVTQDQSLVVELGDPVTTQNQGKILREPGALFLRK